MKDFKYNNVLAIVDPPYGIQKENLTGFKKKNIQHEHNNKCLLWDNRPTSKYFQELFRISKNQIIWGMQYFIDDLKDCSQIIVWNKLTGNNFFADCELAWTSFKKACRIYKYTWNGMLQQDMKNKEKRIHPHQKPVALYKWLLQNYAKLGDLIIDSRVGSGSLRIACYELGFDFIGVELDEDYWEAQEKRFMEFKKKFHNEFYIGEENDLFKGVK
jgi:site-specific DNA-methyltransferase (adenine-specific)